MQPEESIAIQHAIGADIIMQLDDVGAHRVVPSEIHTTSHVVFLARTVSSLTVGPRVGEAMWRTVRWLDRCITAHEASGRADVQNLFAIVQGGLDPQLRDECLEEMVKRKDRVAGYAIGGLSGGEAKGISTSCRRRQRGFVSC